jgi:hypothetical protein
MSIYNDVLHGTFDMLNVPTMTKGPVTSRQTEGNPTATGFELVAHIKHVEWAIDQLNETRAHLIATLEGWDYDEA